MPERQVVKKAKEDIREGKSPSTAAGVFVHEEIEHVREGKHGARSPQQAIAIGLSKARRAGVPLQPPAKGKTSTQTRIDASGNLSEQVICVALFLDGPVEQFRGCCFAQHLREVAHSAVNGNLVVLHALRGGDDGGIANRFAANVLNQVFGFVHQGGQDLALDHVSLVAGAGKKFLVPRDLDLRLLEVRQKRLLQLQVRSVRPLFGPSFRARRAPARRAALWLFPA